VLTALLASTKTVAEETFGVESTLNIILLTFLAFALVFQTPMVMVALARIGLVNVQLLRKYRRYAGMGILLTGGIAAPDASPVTMLLIAAPMYVLYEASIWIIVLLEKSWRREAKQGFGNLMARRSGSRASRRRRSPRRGPITAHVS
jgi:sec-independent protein translocase protein TatC